MENKQQTALDFYIDKMNEWFEDACVHCELCKEDNEIYQQAKAMEKKQILQAVYDSMGTNFDPNWGRAEQYYNETYNK